MKKNMEKVAVDNSSWFKSWFNSSLYHNLYAHRDENEASQFINAVVQELNPAPGSRMLDLGCGSGRHSKCLASKGFDVTGLDLASSSIRMAKRFESSLLRFYRHDMRIPFGRNYFDYIFNFFTSFGYFQDEQENHQVIDNISSALKPGGILLLDYMNAEFAEARIIPEETIEIDGIVYHITRWTTNRYFFKKIEIKNMGMEENHLEQVAKFDVEDFNRMLSGSRMKIQKIYGDYFMNEYHPSSSPRLIIQAQKH